MYRLDYEPFRFDIEKETNRFLNIGTELKIPTEARTYSTADMS